MRVNVLRDYDYRHRPAVIQAFRAGTTPNIPKETADELIALGVAELADTPKAKED